MATANYVARQFGIHSAMSCAEALRRCPHAVFVRPRKRRVLDLLEGGLGQRAPGGSDRRADRPRRGLPRRRRGRGRFRLSARDWPKPSRPRSAVPRAFTPALGVSTCKVVAKIASDQRKPGGLVVVLPGREAEFLAPFDVRRLPGVGPRSEARLRAAGIETIGALAALSDHRLRALLPGRVGKLLRDRARGNRPAWPRAAGAARLDQPGGDVRPRHRRRRAASRGAPSDGRRPRRASPQRRRDGAHGDDEGAVPGLRDQEPVDDASRSAPTTPIESGRSPARCSTGRSPTGLERCGSSAWASQASSPIASSHWSSSSNT